MNIYDHAACYENLKMIREVCLINMNMYDNTIQHIMNTMLLLQTSIGTIVNMCMKSSKSKHCDGDLTTVKWIAPSLM